LFSSGLPAFILTAFVLASTEDVKEKASASDTSSRMMRRVVEEEAEAGLACAGNEADSGWCEAVPAEYLFKAKEKA